MILKNSSRSNKPVGVIGIGSFGTAIANMLAEKSQVIVYARKADVVEEINARHTAGGRDLHPRIEATSDIEYICQKCEILFPVVSSSGFREVMQQFAPFLHPYHILIHGTKGLSLLLPDGKTLETVDRIKRDNIATMSEVILNETVVVRVGCLAGPNLAKELSLKQPAATVIASKYNEVILEGQRLLRNDRFQVYGNQDIIGVELSGVLKNIIAIAAGALGGMGLGENAKGLLISRGMVELIYLGKALGGGTKSFIGLAGIGDLVATCSSKLSRNYTVGFRLANGEKLPDIIADMEEVAEGINTVKLIKTFAESTGMRAPITENLYKVLFENFKVEEALQYLMKYPFNVDVDFL
ncbi:NAD(P)H-dependent glycerol-3-phosphate dehydrogenase [Litoribacter ruber]|uniref:Glycerol-3-phosphate dehydrogenase [NAD(P)+] n=1 Tax=Litoribacter ruber TaxID=702568 RepID=A0AAP2G3X5_9BACT|nr:MULTISPECIES: NAD(P)H-dependent glycerol-3-phosphate dehydrogenase [Litoribacter]MBS9523940.1 NAD(P)H-dependent glycerol-3-phosphate dehydrogenase [Litoribacter alkaliphilus]MBT0811465.1 NAD(P)H-dependent glycerol-3-phosphate dehydrogenase [Litoribacter ruber]